MRPIALTELEAYFKSVFAESFTNCPADSSINGVQVANTRGVSKLAVGVDCSWALIERAVAARCDALLVHHGIYWGRVEPLVGHRYRLVKELLQQDIALVAIHLPLDLHPELGNNAGLIDALAFRHTGNFGNYKGLQNILFAAEPAAPLSFGDLAARYRAEVGQPLSVLQTHDGWVKKLGICSGGGLFGLEDAHNAGCDSYLSGDANHTAYHLAQELPINLIAGGHYLTETFGVKRLAAALYKELQLPFEFFELPTGL